MADRGDTVITLPDDDDKEPRTQDQRGNTGRGTNAKKLEADVEKALDTARAGTDTDDASDNDISEQDTNDLAKMRRDLERANRRAEQAERRVAEAEGGRAEALDAKTQADLNMLKGTQERLQEARKAMTAELAQAHAEGDFQKIADVQAAMIKNSADTNVIENGILALENAPKQREALRRRGENPSDENRFAQITKDMHPAAKQWLRDNPEYYRDDELLQRVIAAHNIVMTRRKDRPTINSPEYFEAVEDLLDDPKFDRDTRTGNSGGGADDDEDDDNRSTASRGRRRQSIDEDDDDRPPAAAPPSRNGRGVGGADRDTGRQVRLSAAEIEMAEASGLSPQEYARNKRALLKEDRIGPRASNRNRMH